MKPGSSGSGFVRLVQLALRKGLEPDEIATPDGELLYRVLDLDFALRAGVTVTLSEISVEEFSALKILHSERDSYQNEQANRPPVKWSSID